ncbi:MAG: 50S ribosomal protein L20 [bacterium]|nr:50S ribosomal protein L20 [bacterium]
MPRARKGTTTVRKRRKLLRAAKGFKWNRKSTVRLARQALMKAGVYAYRDRRTRKRDKRSLWQVKINAAARNNGTTYSQFTFALKKKNILLNRKMLADLAENEPETFKRVVEALGAPSSAKSPSGKEAAETPAK